MLPSVGWCIRLIISSLWLGGERRLNFAHISKIYFFASKRVVVLPIPIVAVIPTTCAQSYQIKITQGLTVPTVFFAPTTRWGQQSLNAQTNCDPNIHVVQIQVSNFQPSHPNALLSSSHREQKPNQTKYIKIHLNLNLTKKVTQF